MTTQKYAVNQFLCETLLAWVKSGEIAIPEIQRPFVWDATQVRDLLDSLYQGFPIGYIIVWKNPDVRLKDGSLSSGKKILIDGQQRITALATALTKQEIVNKDYKRGRVRIAFNPVEGRFEVCNPAIEKDAQWISDIAPIMQNEISMLKLIREYRKSNQDVEEEHLEEIISQLMSISKKQIGVIELDADLDIETVTEIFIRINREGVSLSQADFVMSKIAANHEYGGNRLRKAIDYFCHLAVAPEFFSEIEKNDEDFIGTEYFSSMAWLRKENDDLYDPGYSDMLRVAYTAEFARGKLGDLVGLLSGRNFETRRYEEGIAENSFGRLRKGALEFMNETNFKRFLMIVKSAGFVDRSLLSSQGALNFCYALYLKLRSEGYEKNDIEKYVRRWLALSLLTSRYSGTVETKFERDIRRIHDAGFGAFLSETEEADLSEGFWNAGITQNLTTSNSRHPVFLTFLAAQCRDGDAGFLSSSITVRSMVEHRGDMHHIFPKNMLKKKGMTRSQYNQVANYVYTQQEINIAIGDASPQEYMGQLHKQCETGEPVYGGIIEIDAMKKNFEANAIPQNMLDGEVPEYSEFLDTRRRLIASRLRNYYYSL